MSPTTNKADKQAATRANRAAVAQRVDEVLRIILDGAQHWDVKEYIREKEQETGSPWFLAEDRPPLSDSQIWRYIEKANAAIAESCRASSKKLIRRHLAQRRNLYAKSVSAGDFRVALAALDSEAELLGIFPPKRKELTGANGGPLHPAAKPRTGAEIAADLEPYKEAFAILYASELGRPDDPDHAKATSARIPPPEVIEALMIEKAIEMCPPPDEPAPAGTVAPAVPTAPAAVETPAHWGPTPRPVESFPRPIGDFPRRV